MKRKTNVGKGHTERTEEIEGVYKNGEEQIEEQDDIKELYGIDDNDEYAG